MAARAEFRIMVEIVKTYFPEVEVERVERDKLMPFRGTLSVEKLVRLLGYVRRPTEVGLPGILTGIGLWITTKLLPPPAPRTYMEIGKDSGYQSFWKPGVQSRGGSHSADQDDSSPQLCELIKRHASQQSSSIYYAKVTPNRSSRSAIETSGALCG
jgi:hypothetical protein